MLICLSVSLGNIIEEVRLHVERKTSPYTGNGLGISRLYFKLVNHLNMVPIILSFITLLTIVKAKSHTGEFSIHFFAIIKFKHIHRYHHHRRLWRGAGAFEDLCRDIAQCGGLSVARSGGAGS